MIRLSSKHAQRSFPDRCGRPGSGRRQHTLACGDQVRSDGSERRPSLRRVDAFVLSRAAVSACAALALLVGAGAFAGPAVVINEVDVDQVGTDTQEFIELFDGGVGNTDLSGLVVVLYNGATDESYDAIDLDGASTDGSGYFVIGSAAVPGVDLVAFANNGLQNGADAIALHLGSAADFPGGTPVTATNLVDAVVYGTSDGNDDGLLSVLGGPQADENGLGDQGTDSIGRLPDGAGSFTTLDLPTPGSSNGSAPAAVVLSIQKSGPLAATPGNRITYELLIVNSGSQPAEDVLVLDVLPEGVSFLGESSPGQVILVDDTAPDLVWSVGAVGADESVLIALTVQIPAEITGEIVNSAQVTTTSAEDDPKDNGDTATTALTVATEVVINEILADPAFDPDDQTVGDANGDGIREGSEDEFVELFNNTGVAIDLSGWTLSDSFSVRHVFPAGTVLADQCAVVIFGGGTPTGAFGGAMVQTASEGTLGLNNTGDTIVIKDDQSVLVCSYSFGAEGNNNQSLTRDPDIVGPDPLVLHEQASGSQGAPYSPGSMVDGSSFPDCQSMPPCPGNTNDDAVIDVLDIINVVLDWGTDGSAHGGNLIDTGDSGGVVDQADLLAVLVSWGPCS